MDRGPLKKFPGGLYLESILVFQITFRRAYKAIGIGFLPTKPFYAPPYVLIFLSIDWFPPFDQ